MKNTYVSEPSLKAVCSTRLLSPVRGGCFDDASLQEIFVPRESGEDLGFRVIKKKSGDSNCTIVLGGSWYDSQGNARLGYRFHYDPDSHDVDLGFRVIRRKP